VPLNESFRSRYILIVIYKFVDKLDQNYVTISKEFSMKIATN
jgi:hypothetical protein